MTDRKEIQSLVVTCRRLDRPHGGAALRNLQNVRGLAKLGPVDVITVGPNVPPAPVDGIRHYQHIAKKTNSSLASKIWSKRWVFSPMAHPMVSLHYQKPVVEEIRRRFQQVSYDVAVVEELGLARYMFDLNSGRCLTILDAHNIESALSGDMAVSLRHCSDSGRLGKWKRNLWDRQLVVAERRFALASDRVWACSSVDRAGFVNLIGNSPSIDVIPNSIDVPSYAQLDRCHEAEDWRSETIRIAYLGAYSYYPNEQAALELIHEVLPILTSRGVHAKLQLIGGNPSPAMKMAASNLEDVEITGTVESVLPYLKQQCLIVLPIRLGGGTRLKILEAFASSRPVISTAKGVEGIEAEDGRHLLVRESSSDIADAVIRLWNDSEMRTTLCRNAHQLVSESYSFESTGDLIRESVLDTIRKARMNEVGNSF